MIANVNGIELNYEQEGAGADLVLLPGLGASTHVWYAQLKGLASAYRVTAVNLRGQGLSATPEGPYSMRLFADDVAALLEHLGIQQAIVVGSSMASLVAVELAAAYPDRVRAIVLAGGFAVLPPAGKERMEQRAWIAESEGMGPLADLVVSTAMGQVTHQTQPALVGLFRAVLLRNAPLAYAASCRAIVAADVTPLLAQVQCPALLLVGDGEQVAPLPAAQAIARELPQAVVQVIPNAGHLPFMEQPALFNAALLSFASNLSGGVER